jgi:hypothetical protein
MRKSLRDILFGSRTKRSAADSAAIKKVQVLADINEASNVPRPPRVYRTIGLTEQRLRARNKQSWITSTKGWSNFFGRFTTFGKR